MDRRVNSRFCGLQGTVVVDIARGNLQFCFFAGEGGKESVETIQSGEPLILVHADSTLH
jgi:hypothetical protein